MVFPSFQRSGILLAAGIATCTANPGNRAKVPNGFVNGKATGHSPSDGTLETQFRGAFKTAGYIWTVALCEADFDGDGASNGLELGDPCCVWAYDSSNPDTGSSSTAAYTTDITRPGDSGDTTSRTMPDCTIVAAVDCVESEGSCSTACTRLGYSVDTEAAGDGAVCQGATPCTAGEGACPEADVDCHESEQSCSASCTRLGYTLFAGPSGNGAACGGPTPCDPGEGACPAVPTTCVANRYFGGQNGHRGASSQYLETLNREGGWGGLEAGLEACGASCAENDKCQSFSYNTFSDRCELYSSASSSGHRTSQANYGHYLYNVQPNECDPIPDVDCIESQGSCSNTCQRLGYTVDTAQSGNGAACAGSSACTPGDDACPVPDVDCKESELSCSAACSRLGYRIDTAQSGNGAVCAGATDCSPGDGACPAPDVNCDESEGSCSDVCGRLEYKVNTDQSGNGAQCAGPTLCSPGEGLCPADAVNCVESEGVCTSACARSGYKVDTEPKGVGAACAGPSDCSPGEGACPVPDVDCVESELSCSYGCTRDGYRVDVDPSGNGAACSGPSPCLPGEGACPVPNVACVESEGSCANTCERVGYSVDTEPSGNGLACAGPAACNPGDGACPADCEESEGMCSSACERLGYTVDREPLNAGAACAGPSPCPPGADACPNPAEFGADNLASAVQSTLEAAGLLPRDVKFIMGELQKLDVEPVFAAVTAGGAPDLSVVFEQQAVQIAMDILGLSMATRASIADAASSYQYSPAGNDSPVVDDNDKEGDGSHRTQAGAALAFGSLAAAMMMLSAH